MKLKSVSALSRSVYPHTDHSGNPHKPMHVFGFARLCGSTATANLASRVIPSTMTLFMGDFNVFNWNWCDVFKESQLFRFQYHNSSWCCLCYFQ